MVSPTYRCEDCAEGEILCGSCILTRHKRLPLHLIKVFHPLLLSELHAYRSPDSVGTVPSLRAQRCAASDLRSNLDISLMRPAVPLCYDASWSYTPMPYTRYRLHFVAVAPIWTSVLNFFDTRGGRQPRQTLRRVPRARLCVYSTHSIFREI